jgi:FkbM family methyltransferase
MTPALKPFKEAIKRLGVRMFRSVRAQSILERIVGQLDLWRGYGSGAFVETSGETALFELLRAPGAGRGITTVFDVGANVGAFTSAALHALGAEVVVHAFEPAGDSFRRLSAQFADEPRVVLNNAALGSEPGRMPLYGTAHDSGLASLVHRNLSHVQLSADFQETVTVVRLTDYCEARRVKEIHLLKLDVEGFELEVLAGAAPLFASGSVQMCSFEFGGCNVDSRTFLRDFVEFFSKHEMRLSRITPSGTLVSLPRYSESLERFATTNYVAVRTAR